MPLLKPPISSDDGRMVVNSMGFSNDRESCIIVVNDVTTFQMNGFPLPLS